MGDQHLAIPTTSSEIKFEIDWSLLLEQRSAVLRHTETPAYLLLPEIHQLMDEVRQDNLLLMINTLWHTGARISECLALTPNHFVLETKQPYVSVETLKSRGRPKRAGRVKPRLVPLCDPHFIQQLERYVSSHHIRKNQLLFPLSRQ
jgi:integrase